MLLLRVTHLRLLKCYACVLVIELQVHTIGFCLALTLIDFKDFYTFNIYIYTSTRQVP